MKQTDTFPALRLLKKKSLPYRRACSLVELLVAHGKLSIHVKELDAYIRGHIGASDKTVRAYLGLMRQFELIKPDRQRVHFYQVNLEKCFFSPRGATYCKTAKEAKKKLPSKTKSTASAATGSVESIESSELHYSRTLVHLEDRGLKKSCSFKGYQDTWRLLVDRCKAHGLDVCYVMDAFINAFLIATDEGKRLVSTPVHLGLSAVIVNLILPYVVQKPRRRRRTVSYKEEEF